MSVPGASPPGADRGSSPEGAAAPRLGAGRLASASPPFDARFLSKRTRELQASDRLWAPPDEFEGERQPSPFGERLAAPGGPTTRRARAGTLPSRLTANPFLASVPLTLSTSATAPAFALDAAPGAPAQPPVGSRLRSGSLNYSSPFGPSLFSTNWSQRPALANSFAASGQQIPQSPAHASFSPVDESHHSVQTLDYLGLDDSHPLPSSAPFLAERSPPASAGENRRLSLTGAPPDFASLRKDAARLRSYSVNATERYEDPALGLDGLLKIDEHHEYSDAVTNLGGYAPPAAFAGLGAGRPRSHTTATPFDLDSQTARPYRPRSRPSPEAQPTTYFGVDDDTLLAGDDAALLALVDGYGSFAATPSKTLWVDNLPASTTPAALDQVLGRFGTVSAAKVLPSKTFALVNMASLEAAIQARTLLNGTDVFGVGPLAVGYFTLAGGAGGQNTSVGSVASGAGHSVDTTAGTTPDASVDAGPPPADLSYSVKDGKLDASTNVPARPLGDLHDDILSIVADYGADAGELEAIRGTLHSATAFTGFIDELPVLPDPNPNRVYDAPKLRDIRKRIDNGHSTLSDVEGIALDMLDEIVELSSDYLGNTVVQKLFDHCTEHVKTQMLAKIAPYLAQLGIHKNGTWAAQKIIDVARTPEQMEMIANALRPYTVHLFLDQFGNYVLQCCLRFGSPYNDFIFETMLSQFWDIAQGRFGARAMRACLESHYANKEQQRVLAAAITLHAVQLATNANGALLLTWFLDTCTLPNRHRILAPRLIPHLVPLCTHKLASLTVLKVVNYRAEPEARQAIFDTLLLSPDDSALEEILSDSAHGPTVIFKILTTPFLEGDVRRSSLATVRNVLVRMKVFPSQGYRRLMDEVGLSTRAGTGGHGGHGHGHGHGGHSGHHGSHGSHGSHKGFHGHNNRGHHADFASPGLGNGYRDFGAAPGVMYYPPALPGQPALGTDGLDGGYLRRGQSADYMALQMEQLSLDQTYDGGYDQAFDQSYDQAYDQSYDQSYDQTYDQYAAPGSPKLAGRAYPPAYPPFDQAYRPPYAAAYPADPQPSDYRSSPLPPAGSYPYANNMAMYSPVPQNRPG
ncbi:uncharacterized protein V1510DRAFT_428941 [Dipodascopsis tothii]|uniref:uncharacterized protein n=1 Tax=Dipodascopsis tothii TaxID=44089 RepID=UPI0034CEF163